MLSSVRGWEPTWDGWTWFNVSGPYAVVRLPRQRAIYVCAWNLFNRRTADGEHYWGIGLMQIGHRHLCYIGHSGWSLCFIGCSE